MWYIINNIKSKFFPWTNVKKFMYGASIGTVFFYFVKYLINVNNTQYYIKYRYNNFDVVNLQNFIIYIPNSFIIIESIIILMFILVYLLYTVADEKGKNEMKKEKEKVKVRGYIFFIGLISASLLEVIFTNIAQTVATVIASFGAVLAIYFTIKENQKMRIAQTITKSRIEWMYTVRGFIHEYIGLLNEFEYKKQNKIKYRVTKIDKSITIMPYKLYTARDKIISYLNPTAGIRLDGGICHEYKVKNCTHDEKCDPDCILIKELGQLGECLDLNKHKERLIKITRCYFKAEWERAKEEGYTGETSNNNSSKLNFIRKYKEYSEKFNG